MLLNASVNDDSMTVIVKEYTYEATPNTSIIVGDTGETSSLEQNTKNEIISLFPNSANDFF